MRRHISLSGIFGFSGKYNMNMMSLSQNCALTHMVLGQALAVFQAFSLRTEGSTKLQISKLLSPVAVNITVCKPLRNCA
jgi:hypothetical protein